MKTYDIRINGKAVRAIWKGDHYYVVAGPYAGEYLAENVDLLVEFSVTCQTYEWYGDGAPGDETGGRWKPKGATEVVVLATEGEVISGVAELAFDRRYNRQDRMFRYDRRGEPLMPYSTPERAYFGNGEVHEL